MEITIPKDCCLCDVCNEQVTDDKFVITKNCGWYDGWLYCHECEAKYDVEESDMELIAKLVEGDNISHTDLAKPIVISNF